MINGNPFVVIGILLALAGASWFWYQRHPNSKMAVKIRQMLGGKDAEMPVRQAEEEALRELEIEATADSMEEQLLKVRPGQFIQLIDGRSQVITVITLYELRKFGDWKRSGKKFLLIQLSDDQLVCLMPTAEDTVSVWSLSRRLNTETARERLIGSDVNPGPIRQFDQSSQLGQVTFQEAGTTWRMKDVGRAEYESQGRGFLRGVGRVRFASARSVDKSLFMFFPHEQSDGDVALWVGESIDTEVDIEEII